MKDGSGESSNGLRFSPKKFLYMFQPSIHRLSAGPSHRVDLTVLGRARVRRRPISGAAPF